MWIRACSMGTSDAAAASTASTSVRCRDFSANRATATPASATMATVTVQDQASSRISSGESVPAALVSVVWPIPAS